LCSDSGAFLFICEAKRKAIAIGSMRTERQQDFVLAVEVREA